jgi:hypothetical protein
MGTGGSFFDVMWRTMEVIAVGLELNRATAKEAAMRIGHHPP